MQNGGVSPGVSDLELWRVAVEELRLSSQVGAETFGGHLFELPGVVGVLGGSLPLPCWVYEPTADLEAVAARFAGSGSAVHVVADHPDQELLLGGGWQVAEALTEMVLVPPLGEQPAAPPGVVIEHVQVPEGVAEFYATMARGFEAAESAPEMWLPRAATETQGVQLLLARDQRRAPVGTAGLRRRGRGASLFAISVPPSHRGRGIGTALTARAAQAAFGRGAELVQLQASAAGLPVYERAGFRAAGDWVFYEPRR
jgi:GNAT superfamily N-acetyltransferase